MRLSLIPPSELTPEQKSLYDEMRKGIASNFNAFKVEREDDALMGALEPMAAWTADRQGDLEFHARPWPPQIAILVVGAYFDAAYELYAHIAVAEREKMKPERLATLVANLKPNDFAPDENVAFDFSYALVRGGTLPEPLYRLAVKTFGQHGTNELIYLVGLYAHISTTLNGLNVPVPEREWRLCRRDAAMVLMKTPTIAELSIWEATTTRADDQKSGPAAPQITSSTWFAGRRGGRD
jgi:4-carboxymuconolactone decarboxylase